MAIVGTAGFGALLKRNGTTLTEIDSMSASVDVGEVEMTHMESSTAGDGYQEYLPTTKGLTVSFTGNFVAATHGANICADVTADTVQAWSIVWPGGTTWAFAAAFLTNVSVEASHNGKVGLSGTLRVTGTVTYV